MLIGNSNSITDVADSVELYICTSEDKTLSKSELISLLEERIGSDINAAFIDDIWNELDRRLCLYGDTPPYKVERREIISNIDWRRYPEYLTCLILAIIGNSVETQRTGILFERLSCKAVKKYFGGEAIIYGFPNKQPLKNIADLMYKEFIMEPTTNYKDRGVDIIAWKPFGDHRCSQICGIIQCAAGHDWKSKLLQIPTDAWKRYIWWSGSLPMKGFTVPTIIRDKYYGEIVSDCGLLFDRPRLYRNTLHDDDSDTTLKNDLIIWCEARIANFEN